MSSLWTLLGLVILFGTLLDIFLTALNYDEAGFISARVSAWQWRLTRLATRRLPRRWRPVALRQVTGAQVVVLVVVWLAGVIAGFGFIYYGHMSRTSFTGWGRGAPLDLFGAFYFSAAQLSSVGGSYLTAATDLLRFLSIAETLTGVVLISLILTFLLGVYGVITDLNALCRHFLVAERGAGSAVAGLAPYFRDGECSGLDGHLDGIAESFASYTEGLRLHHSAYYFQSGRDQYALPYAIRMLGGTIGALRWGLPAGHPATTEPTLVPLTFQFLEFGEYLQGILRWQSADVPEVLDRERFLDRVARAGRGEQVDEWTSRFLQLDRDMAALAGLSPLADPEEAYRRYARWLPFAYRAQQIALAVGHDLDYQPVILTDHPVAILADDDPVAHAALRGRVYRPQDHHPPAGRRWAPRRWWRAAVRRLALSDPGHARLRTAGRTVLAAGAAALTVFALHRGDQAASAALYGGFVAMLGAGAGVGATPRARLVTGLLVLLPVGAVLVLRSLTAGSPGWTAVLLVAVALAGVGAGRFGPRGAALGQITFMAFYFALVLGPEFTGVGWFALAAVVGIGWSLLFTWVLLPDRPRRALTQGATALDVHLAGSLDVLVDAVSWARWDPDIRQRVAQDARQLQRGLAFLGGRLTAPGGLDRVDPVRVAELRLRLFDAELAVQGLVGAARSVTGTAVPLELRGRLAGRLELLRAHLSALAARPGATAAPTAASSAGDPEAGLDPWPGAATPDDWPRSARVLCLAADELFRAAHDLRRAEAAVLDPSAPALTVLDPDDDAEGIDLERMTGLATGDVSPRRGPGPATRRAVQAGVATGAALLAGEAVSSTHQYWATISAYQVLGSTDGETLMKGTQRIIGTVLGSIAGFGIALAIGADLLVVVPLLALTAFASTYAQPVSPARAVFWRMAMLALVYESLGRLTSVALELRVLETVFGAVVALLAAWLILPTRTRSALDRDAAAVVRDVDILVTGALDRLGGGGQVTRHALRERELRLDRDLRTLVGTARPLRRTTGSLDPDGVEARLTAYWSLAAYTRHLLRAVEPARHGDRSRLAEERDRAAAVTHRNLSALSAVLTGRPAEAVDDHLDFAGHLDTAGPEADVLRQLERINLTLLRLVGGANPPG